MEPINLIGSKPEYFCTMFNKPTNIMTAVAVCALVGIAVAFSTIFAPIELSVIVITATALSIGCIVMVVLRALELETKECKTKTTLLINSEHKIKVSSNESVNWSKTFIHAKILNDRVYIFDGKEIPLRPPITPNKIERDELSDFDKLINDLRKKNPDIGQGACIIKMKDMTTDRAIADQTGGDSIDIGRHKIALNFANETVIGGGPGIYMEFNPKTGEVVENAKVIWDGKQGSATAQEEALISKSTLYASLGLLAVTTKEGANNPRWRSYYEKNSFNSRVNAYTSDDQLFGIQPGTDFFSTTFLENPIDVSFVSSAAKNYSNNNIALNCGSEVYIDTEHRIKTHLFAAAQKAAELKQKESSKPVEFIIGAFGCGAFAPKNQVEYVKMVATIYRELVPKFSGFFDFVTIAIPKSALGNEKKTVANYLAFEEAFRDTSTKAS